MQHFGFDRKMIRGDLKKKKNLIQRGKDPLVRKNGFCCARG